MERRIVLLGKTGSGKSAAGNTILKGRYFEVKASPGSVTKKCHVKEVGNIKVIDTPGLFDTSLTPDQLKKEISRCMDMSLPGPHVFLLVIRLGRFTEEEKNAVKWIQENFGEDASRYTIILFTHADQFEETTLEDFLSVSPELRRILNICGNRYAFNNKDPNPSQVEKLMQKIDDMVTGNGGNYYTNEMYEKAQGRKNIAGMTQTAVTVYTDAAVGAAAVGAAAVGAAGAAALVAHADRPVGATVVVIGAVAGIAYALYRRYWT